MAETDDRKTTTAAQAKPAAGKTNDAAQTSDAEAGKAVDPAQTPPEPSQEDLDKIRNRALAGDTSKTYQTR